jgi:hypothetical protein
MVGPGLIGSIAATYIVKKGLDEVGRGLDDDDDRGEDD